MSQDKITYEDLKPYASLFTKAPSLLLGRMIKKNANLVSKFQSTVKSSLGKLNDKQKEQLNIILNSDVEDLQSVLKEAYDKTGKKQFKLLSEDKAKDFIKINLDYLKKIV